MNLTRLTALRACPDCVSRTGMLICGCDCDTCDGTGSVPRTPCPAAGCDGGMITLHYALHPEGPIREMTVHHDLCHGTGYADAALSWDDFLYALAYGGWSWVFDSTTYAEAPLVLCSATRNNHHLITSWYGPSSSRFLSSVQVDSSIINPLTLKEYLS